MPDQNAMDLSKETDLSKFAEVMCKNFGTIGAVIVLMLPDGSIYFSGHGVNHKTANEMLSLGIHANLSQHDQLVLAGGAGAKAQESASQIILHNTGANH